MELDLSQSSGNYGGIPTTPESIDKTYPCLYLTCEGVENLPDSGTMKVKYRVKGRNSKEDNKGNETHSVDLELLSIKAPKKQKDSLGSKDDEEAMEDL